MSQHAYEVEKIAKQQLDNLIDFYEKGKSQGTVQSLNMIIANLRSVRAEMELEFAKLEGRVLKEALANYEKS